ncbi:MAG: TerB family tellurite resistance protein [Ignavibacterium sp.]|nr:MAG: TerB family tellurite resistance protein [Ignavibacterium sp.]
MFDYIRKILSTNSTAETSSAAGSAERVDHQKQLQVATSALFIEMARADGVFSVEEREQVISSLQNQFGLEVEYVNDLVELSKTQLSDSISLYEFSSIINEHFSNDDKLELLKNLWRLIYTDKKLDKYEDRLIKIIGGMINIEHKQIINTKMFVRDELNLK